MAAMMDEKTTKQVDETNMDGLQRSGYHYAHGMQYYADGRICEAPKLVSNTEEVEEQVSQSRWNFSDYHWEERDILPKVKNRMNELLVGHCIWQDKRCETDKLYISAADVVGWAVSNVRKGSLKNAWEFSTVVTLAGSRSGVELKFSIAASGLDHELLQIDPIKLPSFEITSEVGKCEVRSKVVSKDGEVIERVVGEVESEKVMRVSESFLKVVKQKGVPFVQEKVIELLKELAFFGKVAT